MTAIVRLGGTSPEVPRPDVGSDFERLGGMVGLAAIIDDFLDVVFADPMIGFLFRGKNLARIRAMELAFAARHLGGTTEYDGRPITEAHARSPISGGHFARRREILRQTLVRHGTSDDIVARWLAHVDALRDDVLGRFPDACELPGAPVGKGS